MAPLESARPITSLASYDLEDLEDASDGNHQVICILNGDAEVVGPCLVGKVGQPGGGIDDVQPLAPRHHA